MNSFMFFSYLTYNILISSFIYIYFFVTIYLFINIYLFIYLFIIYLLNAILNTFINGYAGNGRTILVADRFKTFNLLSTVHQGSSLRH